MQRPWRRAAHWLVLMVCSTSFLIEPRTTSPEVISPTVGWGLLHQLPIKTVLKNMFAHQSDHGNIQFSSPQPFDPRFYQVGKTYELGKCYGLYMLDPGVVLLEGVALLE